MKGRAALLLVASFAIAVQVVSTGVTPVAPPSWPKPEGNGGGPPPPPPGPGPDHNGTSPSPPPPPAPPGPGPDHNGTSPSPPPPPPQPRIEETSSSPPREIPPRDEAQLSPHSGKTAPVDIVEVEPKEDDVKPEPNKGDVKKQSKWASDKPTSLPWRMDNLLSPQDLLLQEIRSLDENSSDEKAQKGVFKAIDAIEAELKKGQLAKTLAGKTDSKIGSNAKTDGLELQELLDSQTLSYNDLDDVIDEELDDSEWGDDDDDDVDDELDDEEEILFEQNCPVACKCSSEFTAAKTARCEKLFSEQNFGPDIAHLTIDADEIKLGSHALREYGLQQLESIAFVNTAISDLDRSAFDGVSDLFSVNLTRNSLSDIHPDTFQNNTQLSFLTISGNNLEATQTKTGPHAKYFLDAPSVAEFDLARNNLPRLLPTTFVRMPRLLYVNLRGNKLRAIERAVFHPLEQLEEVDLSDNQLNGLPADLFDDNEYFEILHVSGNNLTTLATIKATRLVSLNAANNKIKIITKDDLVGLPELERLELASNGLKRIHQHAFAGLDDLTYLDLSNNKLTTLTEHHLRTNSRLEILLLNDNEDLETLPVFKTEDGTFSIYRMECAGCGLSYLQEGTFDSMPALNRLNLARNHLSRLPKNLFNELTSLRELDLSDNLFSSLDAEMFRGARTMNKLNLAGNKLTSLQTSVFLLTPSLARLDVARNEMTKVWSEAAVPIENLRFLNVRGNRLASINVEDLRATPKLSGLDVSHNPLQCDQEFNESIQWLTDHGVSPTETIRYLNLDGAPDDYAENDGPRKWSELAGSICSVEDGPPPRGGPRGPDFKFDTDPNLRFGLSDDYERFDQGQGHEGQDVDDAWTAEEEEYEDWAASTSRYGSWYHGTVWPVVIFVLVTFAVILLFANVAVCLSKRRGRGPVIRAPMILRPGLIDNKNCGLVYKPLQEEIPTPQMAKRGSFYSSSTFHYDKIVPESV